MALVWACPYDGRALTVSRGRGWFHRLCPACGKKWNEKGKPVQGHNKKALQI